jgi:anti-sigma B factor antagonist
VAEIARSGRSLADDPGRAEPTPAGMVAAKLAELKGVAIKSVPRKWYAALGGLRMSSHRRIHVFASGPMTVARIIDKKILDELVIQELGAEVLGLIEQDGHRALALDFSDVEFLSSAALGKLITLDRKMKTQQGRLSLCSIRPEILEVFQITKLNKVFDIRKDVAEAAAAFGS